MKWMLARDQHQLAELPHCPATQWKMQLQGVIWGLQHSTNVCFCILTVNTVINTSSIRLGWEGYEATVKKQRKVLEIEDFRGLTGERRAPYVLRFHRSFDSSMLLLCILMKVKGYSPQGIYSQMSNWIHMLTWHEYTVKHRQSQWRR